MHLMGVFFVLPPCSDCLIIHRFMGLFLSRGRSLAGLSSGLFLAWTLGLSAILTI